MFRCVKNDFKHVQFFLRGFNRFTRQARVLGESRVSCSSGGQLSGGSSGTEHFLGYPHGILQTKSSAMNTKGRNACTHTKVVRRDAVKTSCFPAVSLAQPSCVSNTLHGDGQEERRCSSALEVLYLRNLVWTLEPLGEWNRLVFASYPIENGRQCTLRIIFLLGSIFLSAVSSVREAAN